MTFLSFARANAPDWFRWSLHHIVMCTEIEAAVRDGRSLVLLVPPRMSRTTIARLLAKWAPEVSVLDDPEQYGDTPDSVPVVFIGNRYGTDDLAGRLIAGGATVCCLPAVFDPSHPDRHPDDTRAEGEPMDRLSGWADRMTESPIAWRTRYQMRPVGPVDRLRL